MKVEINEVMPPVTEGEYKAREFGRAAHAKGIMRRPIMDPVFWAWAKEGASEDFVGLCTAWIKGWDEANLSR